jgi:hypothetical protein
MLDFDPETLWTPERSDHEFPPEPPKTDGNGAHKDDGSADEASLPADTLDAIQNGVEETRRSDVFFNVMIVLKEAGWTVDGIVTLLEHYPKGIAFKYRGRLRREVERAFTKIKHSASMAKEPKANEAVEIFDAVELAAMQFLPVKNVVPGLFVEGLTLLCGKPKIGKSWLLLHAANAVASNGFTLGNIHCIGGEALYCSLEDNKRRLNRRMAKLFGNQKRPPRLKFITKMPRLAEGGLQVLRNWLDRTSDPRLIVIDTLAMVRMPNRKDQSAYDADYAAMIGLRELAREFGVAIVVVHHVRKMEADDPFDTISGTLGLTGCPDTIALIKRDADTMMLLARGRDIEDVDKAVTFNRNTCTWTILGEADDVRRSEQQQKIVVALREEEAAQTPIQIARSTGMKVQNIKFLLRKLVDSGAVEKAARGQYQVAPKKPKGDEDVAF